MLGAREQVKLEPATRKARGDTASTPKPVAARRLALELALTLGCGG